MPAGDSEYSVTKYEYDQLGRLASMTDPIGKRETYAYDINGNLTNKTDRNGSTTTNSYDGLNRLLSTSVSTPDGKGNVSHTYAYTITGQRATSDGTTYTYDDLGRLTTETTDQTIKGYSYDAADNRKSFTLSVNGVQKTNTSYDYENLNRLWHVYEDLALTATYSYDDNGNRDLLTYSNGNSEDYDYNLANKLTKLVNKRGTTELSHYDYTYFLDGNQADKTDTVTNKKTEYTYDGLGRLEVETEKQNNIQTSQNQYTYDDSNNRSTMISVTGGTTSTTSYAYDKNNRLMTETKTTGTLVDITRYNYDNNGNQVYKGTENIKPATSSAETISIIVLGQSPEANGTTISQYDGLNQLTKVTSGNMTAEYTYNGDGLRTSKKVNGVTTSHIWDGDQIALELDGAGAVLNKYIRGINLIYAENSGGAKKYYLFNGHGDVVQLTGTDGNVSKTYEYDSFGVEKNLDSADTNVFRYCGEYFDKETNTIYLRARYYDPEIGRFISEDSYWGENNDPLSLNLYTYAENDPIQNVDPDGHWIVDALFLAADVVDFVRDPSLASAAWIVADVASFADPTGAASTAAHAVKAVRSVTKIVKATEEGVKVVRGLEKLKEGVKVAEEVGHTVAKVGRGGGTLHKAKVAENEMDIESRGLAVAKEYKFNTPNGTKKTRYADVVGLDSKGRVAEIHQVGKTTKTYGAPVSREKKAIKDIRGADNYNGAQIKYHPYDR